MVAASGYRDASSAGSGILVKMNRIVDGSRSVLVHNLQVTLRQLKMKKKFRLITTQNANPS